MTDETLQRHFNLLQNEFQKLNFKYQAIKQQYNDLSFISNSACQDNNFFTNLVRTIKSLHKDKKYSDIAIKLEKTTIPGHKLILDAHCGDWGSSDLCLLSEISLQGVDQMIGEQVVKWLYTQEFKDNQSPDDIWKIVEVSHNFSLVNLKSRCQDSLMSKTTTDNCIYFYMKSCELGVENLQKYCMDLIIANWAEYGHNDFKSLGASVLLELLEVQSNYPLHTAVKYNRDDVVFLYINDNFSQLEEVVNVVSDDNEIVLDLALRSKRVELCNTLLKNCANLNLVDNDGLTLLHKAIIRRDEFSSKFLIENGCHLNPLTPDQFQTPLQLIARMKPQEEDPEGLENMNKIAELLVDMGANVSHSDSQDMTAICLAILSGNEKILKVILESGRCVDINGNHTYCLTKGKTLTNSPRGSRTLVSGGIPQQPLWLAICREYNHELLHKYSDFSAESAVTTSPTRLLIEQGADPGCIYDLETGNSILLEVITLQMEEAAIFILKTFQKTSTDILLSDRRSPIESLLASTNNSKETPLHIAVENGLSNLCSLLLQLGADPNAIRRRLMNHPVSRFEYSSSGSLESITSTSSNHIPLEISKQESLDFESSNSSHSLKTADLNPFKDFMLQEAEIDINNSTYSLPVINRHSQNRSSLFETVLSKNQQRDYYSFNPNKKKSKRRSKQTTSEVSVDLCTPVHLAMKSRNLAIISLLLDNDGHNGTQVNWLLCDSSDESPFTLSLWNSLITVADKIFGRMTQSGIKAGRIDEISVDGKQLLHLAVLRDNIEAVQFLIKIGCSINIRSSNGATPLQLAIDKGNINIVRILCLAGADPNVSYQPNLSELHKDLICPLWAALHLERYDIAEILAESGSDVDMWSVAGQDGYDETLLHKAIIEGNENSAIFLINRDCDINSPRESKSSNYRCDEFSSSYIDGSTPLHLACQFGLKKVVKILLSNKDIMANAQNSQGSTALHIAIQFKQDDVVQLLLDPKVKINLSLRDSEGHTAFHIAMANSNQVVASKILQLEPNAANEVDNLGRNFLHMAVQTMNREAMFFLIQINVNLNIRVKDSLQHTPLQLAVIAGAPEDMIRSLILAGARIHDETIEKHNILHLAVVHNHAYLINCLLENGVSTSHQDHNLDTPLHLAMKSGNKEIIETLLKQSSKSIRMKNLKGQNVLHVLATDGREMDVVIFSLLMDLYNDFPLDDVDAAGNTALFKAVVHGKVRLAVALIRKGASLGCINNDGTSLFNSKEIQESILLKLLDSLDNEPKWLDGEICVACLSKFNIKNRKHHCRHCGRLICGKCSTNEIPIVKYGITKPVRVCDTCFNFIVNARLK